MHVLISSLLALLSCLSTICAGPTPETIEVHYHSHLSNGTVVHESVMVPVDDALFEAFEQRDLEKRTINQYFNFDANDATDKKHIAQLKTAQHDAVELSSYVVDQFDKDGLYAIYFGPNDKAAVKKVYNNIIGTNNDATGSAALGNVIWNKKDFASRCTPVGQEKAGQTITVAYAGNAKYQGKDVSLNHVCGQGYKLPGINDVKCEELGDLVSVKMNMLGGVFLHEYTHFKSIGNPIKANGADDVIYGVLEVRTLSDADKFRNADNYKWYAQHNFWHIICQKSFSGPRDARDTTEPECGQGKCTVQ